MRRAINDIEDIGGLHDVPIDELVFERATESQIAIYDDLIRLPGACAADVHLHFSIRCEGQTIHESQRSGIAIKAGHQRAVIERCITGHRPIPTKDSTGDSHRRCRCEIGNRQFNGSVELRDAAHGEISPVARYHGAGVHEVDIRETKCACEKLFNGTEIRRCHHRSPAVCVGDARVQLKKARFLDAQVASIEIETAVRDRE